MVDCDSLAVLGLGHSSQLAEVKLHHMLLSCFVAEVLAHSPAADVAVVAVLHSLLAALRYHIAAIATAVADCTDHSAAHSLSHRCIPDSVVVLGWKSRMRLVVEDLCSRLTACSVCHTGPAGVSNSAPVMVEVAQVCCSSSSRQHDLAVAEVEHRCLASVRLAVYSSVLIAGEGSFLSILTSGSAWLLK